MTAEGIHTYAELTKEMERLQAEIQRVRTKEVKGVIKRVLEAIRFYGITPEELGYYGARVGEPSVGGKSVTKGKAKAEAVELREPKRPGPKVNSIVKPGTLYRSLRGKEWDGTGARPAWLVWALNNGHKLESFEAGPLPPGHKPSKAPTRVRGARVATNVPMKYRDPASDREWNGRGRQPHWFRDAIAAGTPESELLIGRLRNAA